MRGKTVVTSALILFLTVMLVLVSPLATVSITYAASPNASPNPAILGSFVTVSGSGFLPNCGPPGSGAPCIFVITFLPGGGCTLPFLTLTDQLGTDGGGIGVLGFAPNFFFFVGNSFFVTTDSFGDFSMSILLDNRFSTTNYSIIGFDGKNKFCIDPFTIVTIIQLCVLQLGVEQPTGSVLWLGYAYSSTPISQCENKTDVLGQDVFDRTVMIHQFMLNNTVFFFTQPMNVQTIFGQPGPSPGPGP